MPLCRRPFAGLLLALAAFVALAPVARAQSWPARPVRLVVTFPPGGANDIIARLLGQALSERLGQPFIIDNRVGGSGNLGAGEVVRSAPDGYTLLQATVANATNPSMFENMSFNFARDIAPVGGVYRVPLVVVASPTLKARNFPELLALLKASPGKLNYGTGGIGSLAHIAGELFKMMTGTEMTHVPYRGSPPALVDLLNSRLDILFDPLPTSIEHIRSGALRPIAMTSAARSPALPDVPALGEFLPGYEASVWVGITAPRATPPDIVAKLSGEIKAVLADPGFREKLTAMGAATWPTTPAELGEHVEAETAKWTKVIKTAGIKAE